MYLACLVTMRAAHLIAQNGGRDSRGQADTSATRIVYEQYLRIFGEFILFDNLYPRMLFCAQAALAPNGACVTLVLNGCVCCFACHACVHICDRAYETGP